MKNARKHIPHIPTILLTSETYQHLCECSGGICLACGEHHEGGIEPDAENYRCEACDLRMVYGIEQCMVLGKIEISDERT